MKIFKKFRNLPLFRPPYVLTLAGTGTRKPASAGGDGRGHCRGRIAGTKDKVSAAGNP
ncbi:unnamed protein product [Staurois parvus]|uniref:Uncharacterized protein n=1 Tax=Staurois parvus TaxID=386267 RepID=A0ABN9FKG7_9NEOB|nr:unnamed protein product [Staurois parvus]